MPKDSPSPPPADPPSDLRTRLTAAWALPAVRAGVVFAVCWLVYLSNLRTLTQIDCLPPPYAAWSVVRHGSFDLRHWKDDRELPRQVGRSIVVLPDGRWVLKFPPGSTLAVLPVVAPIAAFRETPLTPGKMRSLGKFTAMTYAAGAAAMMVLILSRLAPSASWAGVVLFAAGTGMWPVASQGMWPHAPAVFLVSAGWVLLLPRSGSAAGGVGTGNGFARCALAGAALGLAALTRQSTVLFAVAWGGVLLWRRRHADLGAMAAGVLPAALFHLWYVGAVADPLSTAGYDRSDFYATPWGVGLPGLLTSPSRGLLIFSPALVAVPWGVWRLLRGCGDADAGAPDAGKREPLGQPAASATGRASEPPSPEAGTGAGDGAFALAAGAAALGSLLLYARWFEWWGGWCWGPRFLLEAMPAAVALFAVAHASLPRVGRMVSWGLVGVSVAIQFAGVFGHPRDDMTSWNARRLGDHPDVRVFFDWSDCQIADHVRGVLGLRPKPGDGGR